MLYIIDIDDMKFGVSGISDKLKDVEAFYPKTYVSNFVKGLDGKTQTDLITILSTVGHRKLVSIRKVAEISLAGVIYSKGMDFAIAFNRMTKGGKVKPDVTTTEEITTTTGITTTELTTTTEVTTVEITTTEIPVTTTEEFTTTIPATTTEEITTTEIVTTTEPVTTTEEVTTTVEATTTEQVTTTVEITTTEPIVTTEEVTTTVEITTTEKVTTTEEVTTTELPITTTEKVTTTEEITTTEEAYPVGYYFSENGNDANDGLSPATAKKSLSAIGSLNFSSIRNVFLEKGSEWDENIEINSSGTSGNPIVIDTYGEGDKPKIYGSDIITGWTLHSGNIYKTTVTDFVSQVFADGNRIKAARYPKEGFLPISSVNGTSEFTGNDLPNESSDYYKGATAIIKGLVYHLNFRNISGSAGNTLTLATSLDSLGVNKPFFLINKLAFLTQPNEWYYDDDTNELYVWMPEGDTPNNYEIRATIRNKGVTIANGKNFVSVKNLNITQFSQAGVYSYNSNDIDVTYCDISQLQGTAIHTELVGYRLNYSSNNIKDVFTAGILINYGDDYNIKHNVIDYMGNLKSVGNVIPFRNNAGIGIATLAGDGDIHYNRITNVGFNGIMWNSGLVHIYRNYINGALQELNDGGGIYTFSQSNSVGAIIEENLILNTLGNWTLINRYRLGFGIYLDGGTEGILVKNNVIGMCGGGFNNNGGGGNTITGNLVYSCVVGYNSPTQSSANIVEYNKFYQGAGTDDLPSLPNTHHRFAIVEGDELDEFDYNEYIAPYVKTGIFRGESGNFADFAAWQGSGQDANSSYDGTNKAIGYNDALIFNWTDSNKNFYLNNASNLEDVFTKDSIEDNFILTPYKSKVLSGINSDTVLDYEDSTAPTITEFEVPETYTELTIPITSIITSDDVTQYIITRNDTVPALNDANWSKEKPTSYTFNTSGEKELYLWVRDEAGNISNYKLAEVEISVEFPAEDKLVHAWELNDLTGGTVTDSFGSNDGTASGTSIVNGLLNKAREFDGIDDFVSFTLPTEIDAYLTKDFSVSLWINLKSIINSSVILDFTQSWRTSVIIRMSSFILIPSGSYFVFAVNKYNTAIGTISSDTISTNEWIHLVITYDSSEEEMKFYMNKVLQTDGTNRGIVQATVAGARLGSRVDDTRHTNAIYDQTLFFDEVLTAGEVAALNNNGNGIET